MPRTWVVIDDHGSDVSVEGLPPADRVVCADSGVTLALRLQLSIDLVVGDLDSVPPHDLAAAEAAGAEVDRHPTAKDHTDLELALRHAARTSDEVVVVGGAGGRLDHAMANVAALASDALADVAVRARLGRADVHVVRDRLELDLPIGATVTLLATGGPATGITTGGLEYPLVAGELGAWSGRGVSNVVASRPVTVEVLAGCVLLIHPHDPSDDLRSHEDH